MRLSPQSIIVGSLLCWFFLMVWTVLTIRIDRVDSGILSFIVALGPLFWVGFMAAIVATLIWYLGLPGDDGLGFVLLFIWLGTLYIVPQIVELHPRNYPYGWALESTVVGEHLTKIPYYPFVVLHVLSLAIQETAWLKGIGTIEALRITFQLFLAVFSFLVLRLASDSKVGLLGALSFLAILQLVEPGYDTQTLGLLFFVIILYLSIEQSTKRVTSLLVLVFLISIVATHALSSLVLGTTFLMILLVRWPDRNALHRVGKFAHIFGVIFFLWFVYPGQFLFRVALAMDSR